MQKHLIPLPHGLLKVGDHLSHDIYDRSGKLLLRNGTPLATAELVERLEAGGYFDPEAVEHLRAQAEARKPVVPAGYVPDRSGKPFSAITELAQVCQRLQDVFEGRQPDIAVEVPAIAQAVRHCCVADSDAALSSILVTLAFPHIVRHPVNAAVITAVVLLRQKHDEARLQGALAAALTMNIGALDVHEDLFHQGTALTEEQRARVRGHPAASVEFLLARGVKDPLWLAVIAQHHEAMDGTGYPAGLTGEKILPEAQMVSLADRYCAMVSERTHREAMLPPNALREIHTRHGKAVSPPMVAALISTLGLYPPGTFVRLANGDTAVVVHRLLDPRHPVVYSVAMPNGALYDPPRKRLTAGQPQLAITQPVARKEAPAELKLDALWPPVRA